jgi:hypothetical protein
VMRPPLNSWRNRSEGRITNGRRTPTRLHRLTLVRPSLNPTCSGAGEREPGFPIGQRVVELIPSCVNPTPRGRATDLTPSSTVRQQRVRIPTKGDQGGDLPVEHRGSA